ncbi:MAG TPA: hypothetical protein VE377_18720 [Candidatus Dormibacteraeota bacterium]|nr:hypothetical protein [Candidatus Dormibacteraeota bacterium]
MKIGVYVYGIAAVAYGITDLVWGEFDPSDQPLQAWGDHIPGARIFAYIAAIWLVVAGAALLWRWSRRSSATSLTILYGIFVLFPLPRLYWGPHVLGHRAYVYFGVLGDVCQEIILFVAAVIVWKALSGLDSLSQRAARLVRWTFGLCSIDFGLAHLTAVWTVVPMIPKWMPFGATFWAVLTGIAFVLAGLGIITGVLDVLAARLLGLMLLVFSALALAPLIFSSPREHASWGANAYNLTAIGAAWIVAEWLAARQRLVPNNQPSSQQAKPSLA